MYIAKLFASAACILLGFTRVCASDALGLSVTLDYGSFTGTFNATTGITSFLGVRYADAPVGDLRWRAPVSPPTSHVGSVNASAFAPGCIPTTASHVITKSEDCLFGNVFVPSGTKSSDRLPVLVWFYGGGFQSGETNDFLPDLLFNSTTKPFLFVTFAYRLGQFGFLAGPQVAADGDMNVGLLDQRAGLRWVQRYIHAFGGDETQVTIWGQSAGAGSTMFHLIANGGDNEGLFRAAMGDSPSLNYLPTPSEGYPTTLFAQFASLAGCSGSDIMACLRAQNSTTLARAGAETIASRPTTLFPFAPIFDGSFITTRPVEAFTSGRFARVPVLFGSNTDEGLSWALTLPPEANPRAPNATETTAFNMITGQFPNLTTASFDSALELYPLSDHDNLLERQLGAMYGNIRYICTALLITGSAAKFGQNSFQYHYDNARLGSSSLVNGTLHGADLQAFYSSSVPFMTPNGDDLNLFAAMREYWTSFVTEQTPIASGGPTWPMARTTDGSPRLLLHPGDIQEEANVTALNTRCNFWHGLSDELDQ
ncbi:alpha/beta-hydrolase [Obba rivulosa]|uniref:Carboxylic ester hydrolase n=1 Tax=Obba rivulosa TaxID=1052685 RepID=A0A8E2AXH9_9APHY|nr:alpha/beta-hydrolase [Obba rivulosa]